MKTVFYSVVQRRKTNPTGLLGVEFGDRTSLDLFHTKKAARDYIKGERWEGKKIVKVVLKISSH